METVFASTTRKLPKSGKRRICFPITSRAYYGRSQLLIKKLHQQLKAKRVKVSRKQQPTPRKPD